MISKVQPDDAPQAPAKCRSSASVRREDGTAKSSAAWSLWIRYRDACFTRSGVAAVWVWTAAHDFDFHRAGLHLLKEPGISLDIGSCAMALVHVDQIHIVPLVRLTALTVRLLQPMATFEISERQAEIRREQQAAELELNEAVKLRYAARLHGAALAADRTH